MDTRLPPGHLSSGPPIEARRQSTQSLSTPRERGTPDADARRGDALEVVVEGLSQAARAASAARVPMPQLAPQPRAPQLDYAPVDAEENVALMLVAQTMGSGTIEAINASAQHSTENYLQMTQLGGDMAGLLQHIFNARRGSLLNTALEALERSVTARKAQVQAVDAALGDVGFWYKALDPHRTEMIHVRREDDYNCAITHKLFSDIAYPVAVRCGNIAYVYEAEALLLWMRASIDVPSNHGMATNPIDRTPLELDEIVRAQNVAFGPVGPARIV